MSEIDAVAASTSGIEATRARIAQLQLLLAGGPAATSAATTSTRRGSVGVGSLGVGGRLGANLSADETFDTVLGQVDGSAGLDKSRALLAAASSASDGVDGVDGAALGEKAVSIARRYLGIPYKWGGTDPSKGLDCSGLTQLVYDQLGVDLPRTSQAQAKAGREIASVDDARPGDLVFFDSPVHHVGIYIGDGKILHAPHTGEVVKISKIWEKPSHIRRVVPDGAGSAGLSVAGASLASLASGAGASGSGTGLSGPYSALFARAGKQYGVDPALLSAVAKAESGYRPGAVSRAGARGLMQIMPSTARGLGIDPDVPEQAVDGAARLLSGYLKQYNGRTDLALAAYNAGPGAVRKYGGVPPYAETRTYVQRVTGYWNALR